MSRIASISFVLISFLILGACQKEKHEVLTQEDQQSFAEGSEFYSLVERASMHDGSYDDEIDDSPCFSIVFPFRVVVQGVEVKIASTADLELILDEVEDLAPEEFMFQFPITVTWADYQTISLANMQEWLDLKRACAREMDSENSPITCVEMVFPLKIFIYNADTQETQSVNIASKKQLFVFLENTRKNQVLSFDYPVNLLYEGETGLVVNNNNEFATALQTCDD